MLSRVELIERFLELMGEDIISCSSFCNDTGYSEDQFYYWTGKGKKIGLPSVLQSRHIHITYDWSPSYTYFGVGPKRLTELAALTAQAITQAEILKKLDTLLLK